METKTFEKDGFLHWGVTSANPKDEMKTNSVPEYILKMSGWCKKSDIEFERYKQDCRKRALEAGFEEIIKKGGEVFQGKNVLEAADKYYNWLISIPQ